MSASTHRVGHWEVPLSQLDDPVGGVGDARVCVGRRLTQLSLALGEKFHDAGGRE
jgi:hypothetical protein